MKNQVIHQMFVGEKVVSLIPSLNSMDIFLIETSMDIKNMIIDLRPIRNKLHLYFKVIATLIRSMVIRHKIEDLMKNIIGHLKVKTIQLGKEII